MDDHRLSCCDNSYAVFGIPVRYSAGNGKLTPARLLLKTSLSVRNVFYIDAKKFCEPFIREHANINNAGQDTGFTYCSVCPPDIWLRQR